MSQISSIGTGTLQSFTVSETRVPKEIIREIFSYLPFKDLISVSKCSKQFYYIVNNNDANNLWERLFKKDFHKTKIDPLVDCKWQYQLNYLMPYRIGNGIISRKEIVGRNPFTQRIPSPLAVSSSGKFLIDYVNFGGAAADYSIAIFDGVSSKLLGSFVARQYPAFVEIAPDLYVFCGNKERTQFLIVDIAQTKEPIIVTIAVQHSLQKIIKISSNRMLTIEKNDVFKIWDLSDRQRPQCIASSTFLIDGALSLKKFFVISHQRLVICADKIFKIYDLQQKEMPCIYSNEHLVKWPDPFHETRNELLLFGDGKKGKLDDQIGPTVIQVLDLKKLEKENPLLFTLKGHHTGQITQIQELSNGCVVSIDRNHNMVVWDKETGKCVFKDKARDVFEASSGLLLCTNSKNMKQLDIRDPQADYSVIKVLDLSSLARHNPYTLTPTQRLSKDFIIEHPIPGIFMIFPRSVSNAEHSRAVSIWDFRKQGHYQRLVELFDFSYLLPTPNGFICTKDEQVISYDFSRSLTEVLAELCTESNAGLGNRWIQVLALLKDNHIPDWVVSLFVTQKQNGDYQLFRSNLTQFQHINSQELYWDLVKKTIAAGTAVEAVDYLKLLDIPITESILNLFSKQQIKIDKDLKKISPLLSPELLFQLDQEIAALSSRQENLGPACEKGSMEEQQQIHNTAYQSVNFLKESLDRILKLYDIRYKAINLGNLNTNSYGFGMYSVASKLAELREVLEQLDTPEKLLSFYTNGYTEAIQQCMGHYYPRMHNAEKDLQKLIMARFSTPSHQAVEGPSLKKQKI